MEGMLHEDKLAADLRAARRSRELTQAQVGVEVGVGGSTVAKWESGELRLSLGRALQMCQIFDLNIRAYFEVIHYAEWQKPKLIDVEQAKAWRRGRGPEDLSFREMQDLAIQAKYHGHDPVFGLTEGAWNHVWRNKMRVNQGDMPVIDPAFSGTGLQIPLLPSDEDYEQGLSN
jgi:transcriptional regulator with XRE-family HTH domain